MEHAYINTLVRGDLASLSWVESPNKYFHLLGTPSNVELISVRRHTIDHLTISGLHKSATIVQVYYAPLNFRDIMIASGRLIIDAIPGAHLDRECMLGLEYSGALTAFILSLK